MQSDMKNAVIKRIWRIPLWLSKLRIQCYHCCGSDYSCGVGSIPGPGTSTCCGYSQKKKKKGRKKERKRKWAFITKRPPSFIPDPSFPDNLPLKRLINLPGPVSLSVKQHANFNVLNGNWLVLTYRKTLTIIRPIKRIREYGVLIIYWRITKHL